VRDQGHAGERRSGIASGSPQDLKSDWWSAGVVVGDLKARLAHFRQIKLSVIGRKSGKTISIPVWFVLEGENLYLLPVHGSDTQWYRNVLKNPSIRIDARGTEAEFRAVPITDAKTVKSVIEKFREKYGAGDVKKYYSKFDVAVVGKLGEW
jgi:deazaflavin-dependent oxidoreductase (nitroreductase family)